jgi:GWxTD domain-containing protein
MRALVYTFYLAFLIVLMGSCASSKAAKQKKFANNDYYFNPNISLVHSSNDSSLITIEFGNDDILYARKHSTEPFQANLTIEIADKYSPKKDTLKLKVTPPLKEEDGDWRLQVPFPTNLGEHHISIVLKDQNRRAEFKKEYTFVKSSRPSTLDAAITAGKYNTPIYSNYFNIGDTINIHFPRFEKSADSPLSFYEMIALPALPPPAFSNNIPEIPDSSWFSPMNFMTDSLGHHLYPKGLPIVIKSSSTDQRIYLYSRGEFPLTTKMSDLVEPMRFIMSKSEYTQLSQASDPYTFFCNFWRDCAGNEEKAKDLIAIYYRRVTTANTYFSNTVPGWRTDRGMIYLVYGKPNRVENAGYSERWIYGDETVPGSFSFLFRRKANSLSDNIFVLQRDPLYKMSWEQYVNAWRQGRVTHE